MTGTPLVTVLMSVFNGERHVAQAVESILSQTFEDFELLILNDGSTDRTGEILESYDDARMVVHHQENLKLIRSLNKGLSLAKGQYIARMDADDVSLPGRLMTQVEHLFASKEAILAGSFYEVVDSNGSPLSTVRLQTDPIHRLWRLHFHNTYAHGTVMVRREDVIRVGGYGPECLHAEDYDLWLRLATPTNTIMIPDVLYQYRVSDEPTQVSRQNYGYQIRKSAQISDEALVSCNRDLTPEAADSMRSLFWNRTPCVAPWAGIENLRATVDGFCERFNLSNHENANLRAWILFDALKLAMRSRRMSAGVRVRIVHEISRALSVPVTSLVPLGIREITLRVGPYQLP